MKKVIVSLAILVVVAIGVFGYIVFADMFSDSEKADSTENQETNDNNDAGENGDDKEEISGTVTDEEMAEYEEDGKNPFGESTATEELDDDDFQDYIHQMSHQKVEAEEKWGFYEINSTRIEWLLEGLDEVSDLEHDETYKDILKKWAEDDFSSVDEDHNAVWKLQDGTIGEATGILSEEEEETYIKEEEKKEDPEAE